MVSTLDLDLGLSCNRRLRGVGFFAGCFGCWLVAQIWQVFALLSMQIKIWYKFASTRESVRVKLGDHLAEKLTNNEPHPSFFFCLSLSI